jgi:hypothetical protein
MIGYTIVLGPNHNYKTLKVGRLGPKICMS